MTSPTRAVIIGFPRSIFFTFFQSFLFCFFIEYFLLIPHTIIYIRFLGHDPLIFALDFLNSFSYIIRVIRKVIRNDTISTKKTSIRGRLFSLSDIQSCGDVNIFCIDNNCFFYSERCVYCFNSSTGERLNHVHCEIHTLPQIPPRKNF